MVLQGLRSYRNSPEAIRLPRPPGAQSPVFRRRLWIALGVRWSADGRYLYYNTGTDVMKIMADASEKAKSVYRFQEGLEIHGFDISQDNKYIVYDDSGAEREGTIYVGILH